VYKTEIFLFCSRVGFFGARVGLFCVGVFDLLFRRCKGMAAVSVCLCVRACVAVCARELPGLIKCVDGSLLRKTGLFTHKRDLFTYQRDEVVSVSLGVVLCGWVRVHVSPKQLHLFCM